MDHVSFYGEQGLKEGQFRALQAAIEVVRFLGEQWIYDAAMDDGDGLKAHTYRWVKFQVSGISHKSNIGEMTIYLRKSGRKWYATAASTYTKGSNFERAFLFEWNESMLISRTIEVTIQENDIAQWYKKWGAICYYLAKEDEALPENITELIQPSA